VTPERLLMAYRLGIFPWFNPGEPILWWSPDPRMVLAPASFKLSRSLAKRVRRIDYQIRVDNAFAAVMSACAAPRPKQGGTWISPAMIAAYGRLHAAGHAHSVEVWIDDALVGGLYGVAIGRAFYGESMFSRATDASKLALAHLARQLHRWEFGSDRLPDGDDASGLAGRRAYRARRFSTTPGMLGKLGRSPRPLDLRP
jgi:leucyl/phenylalanyl-tRNA--protein transferase